MAFEVFQTMEVHFRFLVENEGLTAAEEVSLGAVAMTYTGIHKITPPSRRILNHIKPAQINNDQLVSQMKIRQFYSSPISPDNDKLRPFDIPLNMIIGPIRLVVAAPGRSAIKNNFALYLLIKNHLPVFFQVSIRTWYGHAKGDGEQKIRIAPIEINQLYSTAPEVSVEIENDVDIDNTISII